MTSGELQQVYDDASEAAMSDPSLDNHVAGLRAVARAARAAEREACAKVCDVIADGDRWVGDSCGAKSATRCATAIRERDANALRARAEKSNG